MKDLLLKNTKTYNYDLKNSQAVILLQELKKAISQDTNLSRKKYKPGYKWLEKYLEDPNFKDELAEKIGIDVETWKDCFYALIMGAEADNNYGAIYKNIYEFFDGNKSKTEKAFNEFLAEVDDLIVITNRWRKYLMFRDKKYGYIHKKH